jgi:hypothetical protein
MKLITILVFSFILEGCSLHYYDPETKAEHMFGLGHMVMKVQEAGANRVATVQGKSSLGLSTGMDEDGGQFSAGWSSNRTIHILQTDTAIELIWPTNDLLNVRIGEPFVGQTHITPKMNLIKEIKQ